MAYLRLYFKQSLSARRAWIEITGIQQGRGAACVALRKESVDRNHFGLHLGANLGPSLSARRAWIEIFVLLAPFWRQSSLSARRAWIEIFKVHSPPQKEKSLSARRAWIEIAGHLLDQHAGSKSLSARRAWIEIRSSAAANSSASVALRKESVDRNPFVIFC